MPGWIKPGAAAAPSVAFPEPPAWNPAAASSTATDGMPGDRTMAVFARFAAMLRAGLGGATVIDWTDPELVANPGTDGPPWVRLTPQPGIPEPLCNEPEGTVYRCPLVVVVETSTSGANPADSFALWRQIQAAAGTADSQLQRLGVCAVNLKQMPWGSAVEAKTQTRCAGRGVFELTLYYLLDD